MAKERIHPAGAPVHVISPHLHAMQMPGGLAAKGGVVLRQVYHLPWISRSPAVNSEGHNSEWANDGGRNSSSCFCFLPGLSRCFALVGRTVVWWVGVRVAMWQAQRRPGQSSHCQEQAAGMQQGHWTRLVPACCHCSLQAGNVMSHHLGGRG